LHEGAKVFVLDAVDNWKKIKLADGKLGWIIAEEIKEL
jgi:SH3-like domain-containing protein